MFSTVSSVMQRGTVNFFLKKYLVFKMNLKGQNPSGIFLKAFLCEKYSRERSVLSAVMYLE